jgi:hypothetical protein
VELKKEIKFEGKKKIKIERFIMKTNKREMRKQSYVLKIKSYVEFKPPTISISIIYCQFLSFKDFFCFSFYYLKNKIISPKKFIVVIITLHRRRHRRYYRDIK